MKTQIFGTFGPACASEEVLQEMVQAGMTGMRLNLSHTTLAASENYIKAYQKVEERPQILIDMQGPELRIASLEESICLKVDESIRLDTIPMPGEVWEVLEDDDEILLDDGKILLHVADVKKSIAKVQRGGMLTSGKSIKIKDKYISMPPLTEHDIQNIKVAKAYGVTALMQPFVISGNDIRKVREVLKENGAENIQIFAKIENLLGVENIKDILQEADVIVIARGDLGNDMPLWELPRVQKQLEEACKAAGKPYIVVTQMLASMEHNPVPTRAEVSDVFHAVYHGAWGVMLTGETAVGKYPVEAIKYLANTSNL